METLSVWLAISEVTVTVHKGLGMWTFDIFFVISLNNLFDNSQVACNYTKTFM